MATTIVTKSGSGAPAASDLVAGELAVDLTNKRLYTEDSGGTVLELGTNPSGNVTFADNGKAIFGAGSDLQIYHDGSNSYVKDTGTGVLLLQTDGTGVQIKSDGSESIADFNKNGGVNLYYDNSKKLATTATGIDVTGTVTADDAGFYQSSGTSQLRVGASASYNWNISRDNVSSGGLQIQSKDAGADVTRAFFALNGDISFYEDTGTTPKLFWDASAESLGIGTSSPSAPLTVSGDTTQIRLENTASGGRNWALRTFGSALGIYDHTAGAFRQYIDSSGNVGIGTSSPATTFHVTDGGTPPTISGTYLIAATSASNAGIAINAANTSASIIALGDSDSQDVGLLRYDHSDNSMRFHTASTERMRIDSSGNVGIGTDSPTSPLHIKSATDVNVRFDDSGSSSYTWYMNDAQNLYIPNVQLASTHTFYANGQRKVDIDSSGNLLVGTTTSAGRVTVNSPSGDGLNVSVGADYLVMISKRGNDGDHIRFQNSAGATAGNINVTGTTTAYNTSSDQRLKENIADADDAGSKVDAIQVRKFDWKADGSHQDYGMVAQELLEVAPEAVSAPEDPEEMMGVDYSKLVPMMLKEIQSLRARVAQLES